MALILATWRPTSLHGRYLSFLPPRIASSGPVRFIKGGEGESPREMMTCVISRPRRPV